ncbi:MAG TPA: flagellar basal body L-ring protein FlgH [Candidatus Limnocylindria bacterium]|nr:flagellar basal body L-ring protein FlgH [Candidatus Limnocylindria bacterium]
MKTRLSSSYNSVFRDARDVQFLSAPILETTVAALLLLGFAGFAQAGNGSLWKDESSRALVADTKARAIGDIITIIVQENNNASTDNSTKTAKKTGMDASISSFLFGAAQDKFLTKGGQYPAMKFNNSSDFTGGGSINNSENITARIAVRVVEALPNGNLMIEGRRETAFAGNTQEAVLRGVVRSEDIQANNTVFSYNVSDATIRFVSKGVINDATKKGWFTRVLDKVNPL